jgi:glutamyl-tRNA synthetase
MLRYALSPIRDLQIDNLYIALLNYIVAKQQNNTFILYIKDFDIHQESQAGDIIEILKKFAIQADHTIYQSQNLKTYQLFAKRLVQNNKAYICFCNKEKCTNQCSDLSKQEVQNRIDNNEPYSIYIKKPNQLISINDNIKGKISAKPNEIDSFKIINQELKPTNTFASAIDDMSTNITTLIKNENELLDTFKELYIQNMLGYNQDINYYHMPSILDKKNNQSSIIWLFKEGFLPDAIINYLISLNYNLQKEILYLPDIIKWLDIKKIVKYDKYNYEKLKEYNKKHLLAMDSKKLSSIVGFVDEKIGELLKLYLKEDISTLNDLETKFRAIFSKKECNNIQKELSKIIMKSPMIDDYNKFINYLLKNSTFSKDIITKELKGLITSSNDTVSLAKIYPLIKSYILEVARCQ